MVATSGKSGPSKSIPRERKKRFSSKVRTGCVNCKARRIKCPEEKPECFSCLKAGVLCVYATPETRNVFGAKKALPRAQSCFHVFEVDTKPNQRRFDIELVKPKSSAELRTVANVYRTLYRLQPSDIPFDTPSHKAAFGFWVTVTGPRLSAYEQDGQFYKTIVPQFAWRSRAARELVVAAVSVDEKTFKRGTSKLETLVAAFIAFTMDATLYNYKAGQVHLRGARTLVEELEFEALGFGDHSTYEFVHGSMRTLLGASEGYQSMVTGSQSNPGNNPLLVKDNRATLRALRDQMSRYLVQWSDIRSSTTELREFPKSFSTAVRTYYQSVPGPLVIKESLDLLLIVATRFALKHEESSTAFADRTKTFGYVLTRVAIALRMKNDLGKEDAELLEETLKIVMRHLFVFVPDEEEWWAQKESIEKIAREDHTVFEQTVVLKRMNINCGTLSSPPVNDIR